MASFITIIKKFFSKASQTLQNSVENIVTSKRHFPAIFKWAESKNLKVLKIENASLSEFGFSFFQTSRGYSVSKLAVLDKSDDIVKGCYILVTENFGVPDDFKIKWANLNSLNFIEPYIVDAENNNV